MTEILKEDLQLAEEFPLSIKRYTLHPGEHPEGTFHYHDACEVTYVESGSGSYFVNGEQYEVGTGDLIIFNQVEAHGLRKINQTMHVLVLVFAPALAADHGNPYADDNMQPFTERGSDFQNLISSSDPNALTIYNILLELFREMQLRERGYRSIVRADVMKILTYLMRYYDHTNGIPQTISEKKQNMRRLERVFIYINAHYTEQITLEEAAGIACMSPTYFSSYFKKMTGQTFSSYVASLRIKQAKRLMETTDMNTAQIAMECGFMSMSNFYKLYKKYSSE